MPTKVYLVKAMVFPLVMYGCESSEELMLLNCVCCCESPLDSKGIQPVHRRGNQSWVFIGRTDAEVETPILWPPDAKSWLIWKDPDAGKDWGQEKGMIEDEMVGWHHRLNGHRFVWTAGVGDGQEGLACCSSWGRRVGHDWATELNWLNWECIFNLSQLGFKWLYTVSCKYVYSSRLPFLLPQSFCCCHTSSLYVINPMVYYF